MFDDKITIYNYKRDSSDNETWQRTIVKNVMWSDTRTKAVTTDGISVEYGVMITMRPPIKYVTSKAFKALADTSGVFTLNADDNQDVIVYGECSREIANGYRLRDLIKDERCATVKIVNDNLNRACLPNIKVVLD